MIIDMLNEYHWGEYDFVYLRIDFKNRCNVGYAFINFVHPMHVMRFVERVSGRKWARFNSDKICNVTFARIQGREALVDKFKGSK
jgi:RNA recognition motif-containing protein